MTELLDLLALSSSRADTARKLLDQIQPGKTVCLVDPALFLAPKVPAGFVPRPDDGALHVGLNIAFHGPNVSRTMPDRVRVVAAAARALAQRRACRFFYFVHYDSEILIPWLLRREGVPVTVVDAEPAEMLAWYGQLDLHICQMLHSSILSLNAGTPAINLSYDVKNAAFFKLMGLDGYCLPGSDTDAARLTATIDIALSRRDALARQIAARKVELGRKMDQFLADAVRLTIGAAETPRSVPATATDRHRQSAL